MNETSRIHPRRLFWRYAASKSRSECRGFTLLEMMIVIVVIMILIAVAVPNYNLHIIRAKESVLKSNLQNLNKAIAQYTLDKGQAPQSPDDLVTAGYYHELPKDPMTGASDWQCDPEDLDKAADPQQPGIVRCHSSSTGTGTDGIPYSNLQ